MKPSEPRQRPLCLGGVLAASGLVLASCAPSQPSTEAVPAPVVLDSFCVTASKRTWSTKDSPETIAQAHRWNQAIDRRCGVKG